MNLTAPVMAKKRQVSEYKSELLRKCKPRITIPEFCHTSSLLCNYLENLRFNKETKLYIRFFFSFCPHYFLF